MNIINVKNVAIRNVLILNQWLEQEENFHLNNATPVSPKNAIMIKVFIYSEHHSINHPRITSIDQSKASIQIHVTFGKIFWCKLVLSNPKFRINIIYYNLKVVESWELISKKHEYSWNDYIQNTHRYWQQGAVAGCSTSIPLRSMPRSSFKSRLRVICVSFSTTSRSIWFDNRYANDETRLEWKTCSTLKN